MSWNVVLNKFIEIKDAFINKYGIDMLWNYENTTCIEYWVDTLKNKKYHALIDNLLFVEYENFLLIRYRMYSNLFKGESKIGVDDFFDLFGGFYLECRSVVIDIKNNNLVLTPFRKFRNLNECEENSEKNIRKRIDNAKSVEISDKLDGSMQSARFYNGKIIMAGSQSLNPKTSWRLNAGYSMLNDNYIRMFTENPDKTFIFENILLADSHVVKYEKNDEGLYLIGIRDINTGIELSYKEIIDYANKYNILTTSVFTKTFDEILNELDEKSSDEAEGFVVNIDGYKVKIKYNDYCKMHAILSHMSSPNVVIRAVADGEWDDFFSKVPEAYKQNILGIANKVFAFIRMYNTKIKKYLKEAKNNTCDKKSFMIWINKNVPKKYRGFVRCEYLHTSYNILVSGSAKSPKYKKIHEIEEELEL